MPGNIAPSAACSKKTTAKRNCTCMRFRRFKALFIISKGRSEATLRLQKRLKGSPKCLKRP